MPGITLDREEIQALEEERLFLGGGSTDGKRKVSAALLSLPSSRGTVSSSTSSTSGSSASVRIHNFDESTKEDFDLPEDSESAAALEIIGYTRLAAEELFTRWADRPDPEQNPDSLLRYATANLERLHYQLRDLPATQALIKLGISNELQVSLTNPEFSEIAGSQTLHYWLVETMTIRYATLLKLLQRLKSHAKASIANRGDGQRLKLEGVFDSAASSSTQSTKTPPVAPGISAYIKLKSNELPSTYVAVQTKPEALADHVILYKGKAVEEMYSENFIFEDGGINMDSIVTRARGDFNHKRDAWYFTKEEDTAEKYRRWGELRCPQSESWLIQMQVPKSFMDSLRKESLWFSDEWKEYVWYCRGGFHVRDPPEQYDKLWKSGRAQLVEGPICSRVSDVVLTVQEEDIKTKITEDFLLKIDGTKATQSVMMDREAVEQLGDLLRGKIYIDIHPPRLSPAKA